jgi:hypothetical protein
MNLDADKGANCVESAQVGKRDVVNLSALRRLLAP